jgi:hypothetical protein
MLSSPIRGGIPQQVTKRENSKILLFLSLSLSHEFLFFAEAQAQDRVHRIGQTEEVKVYRLVIAGSLEERMLDIHAAKTMLADAGVREKDLTFVLFCFCVLMFVFKQALVLRSPAELKKMNVGMLGKLFGAVATHVRGKRGRLDANAPLLPKGPS